MKSIVIIRKKIKNINIRIKPGGQVIITAPFSITDDEIKIIISKKQKWIDKHIKFFKENCKKDSKKEYITGDKIKYLGNYYTLEIFYEDKEIVIFNAEKIGIYTSKTHDKEHKEKLLREWYFKEASNKFPILIEKYKKIVNRPINKVTIKSMNSRWGSCNYIKNYINLNLKLIEESDYCIEYVIFHELAHLIHPNHSKDFYNYLYIHMPDYKLRRRLLNGRFKLQ